MSPGRRLASSRAVPRAVLLALLVASPLALALAPRPLAASDKPAPSKLGGAPRAPEPWEAGYGSPAKEMLAAAAAIHPAADADAQVLFDDERVSYDEAGRKTVTSHLVYRVVGEDALDGWSSIEAWRLRVSNSRLATRSVLPSSCPGRRNCASSRAISSSSANGLTR